MTESNSPPAAPVRYRRKRILTEKDFQFRFARFVILFAFATAFATSVTVFFTTFSLLGDKLSDVYPQGRLVGIFQRVYMIFGLNLIVAVPVIFYVSLLFSHRIVGPIFKMGDVLRRVGKGDFEQKIVLRKTDELRALADIINEMIRNLKERDQARK